MPGISLALVKHIPSSAIGNGIPVGYAVYPGSVNESLAAMV